MNFQYFFLGVRECAYQTLLEWKGKSRSLMILSWTLSSPFYSSSRFSGLVFFNIRRLFSLLSLHYFFRFECIKMINIFRPYIGLFIFFFSFSLQYFFYVFFSKYFFVIAYRFWSLFNCFPFYCLINSNLGYLHICNTDNCVTYQP